MNFSQSLFCLFSLILSASSYAVDRSHRAKELDARYDDFFDRAAEKEKKDQQRESEAAKATEERKEKAKELERVRMEFVKMRKKAVVDPELEKQWLEEQKQRVEILEHERLVYVKDKDALTEWEAKGRRIPPLKEYDLEGY